MGANVSPEGMWSFQSSHRHVLGNLLSSLGSMPVDFLKPDLTPLEPHSESTKNPYMKLSTTRISALDSLPDLRDFQESGGLV